MTKLRSLPLSCFTGAIILVSLSACSEGVDDASVSDADAATGGTSSGGASTGGASSEGTGGHTMPDLGMPSGGSHDPGDASYMTVRFVVDRGCGVSICHGGEEDFVLMDNSNLHDTLMNTIIPECGDIPLVTPFSPENSALDRLLREDCGELPQMPKECIEGDSCIPQEYRDRITQWITNGATTD